MADVSSSEDPVPLAVGGEPPDEAEPGPRDEATPRQGVRRLLEWGGLVALALLVALLLRTFVVQSFYIPSTSMAPTLAVRDRVLVNKLAYRFGDPQRGDIVVFESPQASGEVRDLIKRIIGLPGETIEGRGGRIYLDGKPLAEPWLPDGVRTDDFRPVTIGPDHYFVMGDNRVDSRDSRVFGPVSRGALVGEAFVRIWPVNHIGFI